MNLSEPDPRTDTNLPAVAIGVLPVVVDPNESDPRHPRTNAATAASAAGARAFAAQVISFYFRAPVKAFFRTRVDYLAYARSLQQQQNHIYTSSLGDLSHGSGNGSRNRNRNGKGARQTWWQYLRSLGQRTTPGVLAQAVKHHGWSVIPDQILPPMIANVMVGAALYTSYLQILSYLHEDSGKATKRVYPPPFPSETFTAGLLAGAIQSFVAAPLDAIQARFDRSGHGPQTVKGRPQSMWAFSYAKLREIGLRGIFAGWSLSLTKDSLGSAVFFCSFEYIKAQSFYSFVAWYYGDLNEEMINILSRWPQSLQDKVKDSNRTKTIRPHYAIEPSFLLLAGTGASFAQQVVLHPLTHVQMEYWAHLEHLDAQGSKIRKYEQVRLPRKQRQWQMLRAYFHAYCDTWAQCVEQAEGVGVNALRRWLYRGFLWNTIRQVPSTSAGLLIFELVRRKYEYGGELIRINKDGYDVLLS